MTDLEHAMECIQMARRHIRKAIKNGKEIDGHLARIMDETSVILDTLDSVNLSDVEFDEEGIEEL